MEIINFVKNSGLACGYKGCIRVTLEIEEIDEKKWYVVKYLDNGMGWSLEDMPAKNLLRLQATKAVVASLGGTVEYYSKPKQGSFSIIKIPYEAIPLEHIKQMIQQMIEEAVKRSQENN